MIQANELRIGNYVFLKSKNKIWKITCGQEIDTGKDSNDFEPIPITYELLLLNLGFEERGSGFGINRFSLAYKCSDKEQFFYSTWHDGVVEIQYIHQLQNLYFAITGKELTLKN
jgi:hypothetical protein